MDTQAHFNSLAAEITAVKDRVQNLIGSAHWPTVGAWKETVLRSILRRHLPPALQIGSGFVISENGQSNQIDVLIYDDSGPVLFRDSDLVIVTFEKKFWWWLDKAKRAYDVLGSGQPVESILEQVRANFSAITPSERVPFSRMLLREKIQNFLQAISSQIQSRITNWPTSRFSTMADATPQASLILA